MLPHPVAVRWTGRVLEYVCELGNSLLVRLLPSPSSIKSTPSRHLTLPPPPSSPNPRPSTPPSSAACGRASSLPLKHSRAFPAPFSPLEPSHAVKKRRTPLPRSSSNSAKTKLHTPPFSRRFRPRLPRAPTAPFWPFTGKPVLHRATAELPPPPKTFTVGSHVKLSLRRRPPL